MASTQENTVWTALDWRWLVLGAAALVLVSVTVTATLWFLLRTDAAVEAPASADTGSPVARYVSFQSPLVVNFMAHGRQRFLQVSLHVMTRDEEVVAGIQNHLPLIRNHLLLLFGDAEYEVLQTDAGREQLRGKAQELIDALLRQEIGKPGVEQVLFTEFVMQ